MELPDELRRLESELAGRAQADPPAALRGRVLGAVHAELGRPASRRTARRGFWSFAAAAAAAALVCANVTGQLARGTDCGLRRTAVPADLRDSVRRIRELLPEMSEREALRQALLIEAGVPERPLPVLHAALATANPANAAKRE